MTPKQLFDTVDTLTKQEQDLLLQYLLGSINQGLINTGARAFHPHAKWAAEEITDIAARIIAKRKP